ncbi:MAG: accessory gene regulator B family protein [Oscillospiraceae bacterium]
MLTSIAQKISYFFIDHKIITDENREIYNYCFELLLSFIINSIILIVLSIITGKFVEMIFFVIGFMPLRLSCGGYHAKNHFRCCLLLTLFFSLFILLLIKLNENYYFIYNCIIAVISIFTVFSLAPFEDANKPLTSKELKRMKRKSRTLIIIYSAVIIILSILLKNSIFVMSVSLGIMTITISLIMAKLRKQIIAVPL